MRATGIVRRIDDLGRIVIPKEIRRTLKIREGDPLEIFTDNTGAVILKKYSPINELRDFAQEYVDSVYISTKSTSFICDRDNIIAASTGAKKDFLDKKVSKKIDSIISNRKLFLEEKNPMDILSEHESSFSGIVVAPIISGGDPIGAMIITDIEGESLDIDQACVVANTGAIFIGKQMEQ